MSRVDSPISNTPASLAMLRWQALAWFGPAMLAAFIVPGIALCRVIPASQIVWAIAGATVLAGFVYVSIGIRIERIRIHDRRAEDLVVAGLLLIATGVLWSMLALEPGPVAARKLPFWSTAVLAFATAIAAVTYLLRRARQLAALREPS